jgi:hypothetical protein
MNAYHIIQQTLKATRPDLLRALNPRVYRGVTQWDSPEIPAVHLGSTLAAFTDPMLSDEPGARDLFTTITAITAAQLIAYGVPTYFVSRDLAIAVSQTDPPNGAKWTDIKLPFPAGVFLLPSGMVSDPNGRSYNYVTWCKVTAGEVIAIQQGKRQTFGNDALIFTSASIDDPTFAGLTKTLNAETWPHAQLPAGGSHNETVSNLIEAERDVITTLSRLALGLVMAFEARPTLYAPGHRCGKTMARREGWSEIWRPQILGKDYKLPTRPSAGAGTHTSPRLHWRRGHFRNQAHGPQYTERRIIWIEPMLIGGES